MITHRLGFPLVALLLLSVSAPRSATAAPVAPTPLSPSSGTSLLLPFTISWSSVTDPSGITAYNWQVSPSSTFSPVVLQNSTNGATQDTVSGLSNGTYFWRVRAINGAFEQGAFSQPQTFTVTGAGPGSPGTSTLAPTKAYSTFHPYEVMTFNWSGVSGAATYILQAASDPGFPVGTAIQIDNIPNTTYSFAIGNPEGNYFARVIAVDANGIRGQPSNVITFSVFFNNPIGPAPQSVSPSGTTITLPITFNWNDVPNPQPSGYELQVAADSGFANPEFGYNQITDPTYTLTSLTPGTKFWRVRSAQGDNSPTTAAETAWSAVKSFTLSTAPATPVSVTFARDPVASGDTSQVAVQLTAAVPAGGATVALTSSDPNAAPVPATLAIQGNFGWAQFQMQAGQVTSATPATITATLNGKSASGQVTVAPPALQSLVISPSTITGGAAPGGIVQLTGQAPPGGASVTLSSDSPAVTPPASVFVNPGSFSVSFPIPTSAVNANTTATITATWNGTSVHSSVTLLPGEQPTALTLSPTSTVGLGGSSFGTVAVATAPASDLTLQVTSSNPAVASVPNSVTVPAGATRGGFNIFTSAVSAQTVVTISVSGGGATQSAALTVTPSAPPPAPAISTIALSPSTVTGGSSSTATVTLTSAAPSGGAAVQLTSSNTAAATVPATVTVAAGSTSATFSVTTTAVTTTTSSTITGTAGGASRSATLTVSAPAAAVSLSAVTVTPTSITGGTSAQGRVSLTGAAPAGGFVVSLASNQASAVVPASVTVAQGATSATFNITTTAVSTPAAATITATAASVTRTASLTVNPAGAAVTLTVTATGRSGERVSSSPAGISVSVGSTGSASFASGTSVTLSISNGRDAIWSGACSSGGNKQKTCTFAIAANASVTANVQ